VKRVEAIIRPHRLAHALSELAKLRMTGVTVVDAIGFGRQPGHSEVYEQITIRSGDDMEVGLVPKKLLIMFVEDENVQTVVETITLIARTGRPGDGKVCVSAVESFTRVRADDADE
jgi:nitrogen regulatory protein PII